MLDEILVRVLLVVLALLLIWVLRRGLRWAALRPLRHVLKRTSSEQDDQILENLILPINYLVIGIGILISVQILAIGDAFDQFVSAIGRSIIIIAILLAFFRLTDVIAPSRGRMYAITGIRVDDRILPFLRTGTKLLIIAFGIVIILQVWGYDVAGLIAGLGIAGLAVSLAAQDTLSNLFGFVAIVSDRPFDVGEYIITPDVEGVVEHVGLRSTRVRRLDQAVVNVPNNRMASSAITNWSRLSKRRLDYTLGVTYDTNSRQMRTLLHRIREMLRAQSTVDPESVVVYFMDFGDSALNILVRAYVFIADWGEFQAEKERLHLLVMDIVDDLGLSVAFPSRSLYIENIKDISLTEPQPTAPMLSPREQAMIQSDAPRQPIPQDSEEPQDDQQDMPDEDER